MLGLLEKKGLLFLDGAMGTQLQAKGLMPGEIPELWNLTRPGDVRAVHEAYYAAGSDIVYANTFGANPAKYHGDAPLGDVIAAGITVAREASRARGTARSRGTRDPTKLVALDVGPTGRLLKPAGDFEFDAAYDAFAEQVAAGAKAGADLVAIETMSDTYELKAAVLAARENCNLPILATVALGDDGKLLTGGDVECVAALLEGLRVDVLGFNCGLGPDKMLPLLRRLRAATRLPIAVKPNAGMPKVVDGRTVFSVGPEEFAEDVARLVEAGASVVGGCCGTTPAHMAAVCDLAGSRDRRHAGRVPLPADERPRRSAALPCVVTSGSRAVEIPLDDTIVIGERINPTGKKKLKAALVEGDVGYVLREAVAQQEAGAHILDVNVGVPGIDEPAVLDATVQAVQSVTDLPLQLDTSDPVALERALRHYNGKALVNSVNGKEESMSRVLPLVAKYGGAVVALTLDEAGIPPTAAGRLAIARRIIERGARYGLGPEDFVVDVLCLAVSAGADSANVILEALRLVREELGCRTCLGVSNISFGLPARPLLNATFYTMAMAAGLSAGIINPLSQDMMCAYRAWRVMRAKDVNCEEWIGAFKDWQPNGGHAGRAPLPGAAAESLPNGETAVCAAIRRGLKGDAADAARAAIAKGTDPISMVNDEIVPALEVVGKGFESGKVFLPQLLMSAEAAGAAFGAVRASLPARERSVEKGPIVIATVKGDIHDIGKNICRALLENYGFKVIDLGKDVPPEKVVEAARRENVRLVGLSALMTTTVGFMEETVKLVHSELPGCKVTVGGAVLTAEYAEKIGADFYCRDAMALVRLAESVFPGKEAGKGGESADS
ncbi:MAG: homocysteine S-methyltransferase family protein [Kiritimatiellae bacterium]|nr:homocysteine S-methyltransferase family protein [Kiritimatiellia bacterium]